MKMPAQDANILHCKVPHLVGSITVVGVVLAGAASRGTGTVMLGPFCLISQALGIAGQAAPVQRALLLKWHLNR